MKKISINLLKISLLLILALGMFSVTSNVKAKTWKKTKEITIKAGETVTIDKNQLDGFSQNGSITNASDIDKYSKTYINAKCNTKTTYSETVYQGSGQAYRIPEVKTVSVSIKGVKAGGAGLGITYTGGEILFKITVVEPTGIKITPNKTSFEVGERISNNSFTVSLIYGNNLGETKLTSGYSINPTVVPKTGEVKVTVKGSYTGNKAMTKNIKLTIAKEIIALTKVELNKSEIKLKQEESERLVAIKTPENANSTTLLWMTSDPKVASVDEKGVVTAKGKGTAIITVYPSDPLRSEEVRKKCKVTVEEKSSSGNGGGSSDSRYVANYVTMIGEEKLTKGMAVKLVGDSSWNVYTDKTLAISKQIANKIKNGDTCTIVSIDGNAVEVKIEEATDTVYIYWTNNSTGAKYAFEKVSDSTVEKDNNTTPEIENGIGDLLGGLFSSDILSNLLNSIFPKLLESGGTVIRGLISSLLNN